jgi:hypothetical protein
MLRKTAAAVAAEAEAVAWEDWAAAAVVEAAAAEMEE